MYELNTYIWIAVRKIVHQLQQNGLRKVRLKFPSKTEEVLFYEHL